MTNNYGEPRATFMVQEKENDGETWFRHLLRDSLKATINNGLHAWDYPKDMVIVTCDRCKRRGRYPKARFVELVGSGTSLPDALRILVKDCPKKGDTGIAKDERCGAYFPEL